MSGRSIATKSTIGTSYQGRAMPLIKISDNVATDENEPEPALAKPQASGDWSVNSR